MHILLENKRRVFLLGLGLSLLAVFILLLNTFQTGRSGTSINSVSPTLIVIPTVPPDDTFEISGVIVKNFYKSSQEVSPTSDVVLFSNEEYNISYVGAFQKFIIMLYNPDFPSVRSRAEQKFIGLLKITEYEACRLDVEETVPLKTDSQWAGGVYYLSFCEPK